jgi:hypothetical protein
MLSTSPPHYLDHTTLIRTSRRSLGWSKHREALSDTGEALNKKKKCFHTAFVPGYKALSLLRASRTRPPKATLQPEIANVTSFRILSVISGTVANWLTTWCAVNFDKLTAA